MLNDAIRVLEMRLEDELAIPDSHRETALLLSFIYSLTGDTEKAKKQLTKELKLALRKNQALWKRWDGLEKVMRKYYIIHLTFILLKHFI